MARLSTMRVLGRPSLVFALALGTYLAFLSGIGTAQISPEKHAKHHPSAAQLPGGSPAASLAAGPAPTGGIDDIGKMMELLELNVWAAFNFGLRWVS